MLPKKAIGPLGRFVQPELKRRGRGSRGSLGSVDLGQAQHGLYVAVTHDQCVAIGRVDENESSRDERGNHPKSAAVSLRRIKAALAVAPSAARTLINPGLTNPLYIRSIAASARN